MHNPFTLEAKTILVTGASSGIGRAIAIECSKLGAHVLITGRNENRLLETYKLLEGYGHRTFVCDLTENQDILNLCEQLESVDGIVCNAGVSVTKPIAFVTEEDIENVLSINTYSPILLLKNLIKKKKINQAGSVVFVSSVASLRADLGNAVYGISKAGLSAFMRYLALELSKKRIRCNAILPGMIETALIKDPTYSADDIAKDKEKYPLGRYGEPEEVAYAAIYLLSDASKWVTGTSLVVDGGLMLK